MSVPKRILFTLLLRSAQTPLRLIGVQELLRFFGKRIAKAFLVTLLDGWVLVAESHGVPLVQRVKNFASSSCQVVVSRNGLAAAGCAASRARHDLDEVVGDLPGLDRLKKALRLPEPADDGHVEGVPFKSNVPFFHPFVPRTSLNACGEGLRRLPFGRRFEGPPP